MIETSRDALVLSLAGYVALAGHGFALPCYRRAKGGNAWYTAECSPPGDHAGTIVSFEIYTPQGVVEFPPDQQRLVAVGDPWQNVFLWNGRVLVGRPDEVWAATEPFRSEIADAAPLSLLDAAACVDSAERDPLAQASFAFMNDRYGPAKAKDWRDRIYLRGKALLIVRRVLGSQARQEPIRRALREITVCEAPGGVLQMSLSGRLLAELNRVSDIAIILGDLREHTAAFSMDVRVEDEARPPKLDPEKNPADNDDLYRTLRLALIEAETRLGPEHPDTATSLNNLAALYYEQARYEDAAPLYTRALAIREKALGPEHPDTATSLNNLAELYRVQGKHEAAAPLYTRVLAIFERAFGPEHPDTATSLNNLAELYRVQGKHEAAAPLYTRVLAIFERAFGPDHLDTAASLLNLAELYRAQGKYEGAASLYTRALAIFEKVLGPDHLYTAANISRLAELNHARGTYEVAAILHTRALAIFEKVLGPDHLYTATCLSNLAALYHEQARYEDAAPLYTRALAIREKALGPDHPDIATSLNNLAALYHEQARYKDAALLYTRALAIREKALGPDHPDTATSLNNLAKLYKAQG